MSPLTRFKPEALNELIEVENDGETGLLSDLIRDYSAGVQPSLSSISTALNEKKFKELERYAHTLKSSSRLLGLMATADLCETIEHEASKGTCDRTHLIELTKEIGHALAELVQFEATRRAA